MAAPSPGFSSTALIIVPSENSILLNAQTKKDLATGYDYTSKSIRNYKKNCLCVYWSAFSLSFFLERKGDSKMKSC